MWQRGPQTLQETNRRSSQTPDFLFVGNDVNGEDHGNLFV